MIFDFCVLVLSVGFVVLLGFYFLGYCNVRWIEFIFFVIFLVSGRVFGLVSDYCIFLVFNLEFVVGFAMCSGILCVNFLLVMY